MTCGSEYRHSLNGEYRYWDSTGIISSINKRNDEASAYLLNEYNPFDFMSIYAGIRYDKYFNIDSRLSPRFSLLFYPSNRQVLKFIYGQSFRTPTLYEKYYYDSASSFKLFGNLKSEYITTYELSYEYKINLDVNLSFSVYYNNISNLINTVTDPIDSMDYFKNIDTYNGLGGSADFNAKLMKNVSVYLNYSYQSIKSDEKFDIVNSPHNLFKFGIVYQLSGSLKSSFEYRYESSRKAYNMSETPEIHFGNLNLIYEPLKDISISLCVRNLFNSTIKSPVGLEHRQAMVPNPGRYLFIRIGWGL
jgi:outer membrane receptor protein involved in Fe transport